MDQKTSRYAIIKDMLKAAFKIDKPRDWQMDIIYQLCYETSTSLCVQKTGGGKRLLVLGTIRLFFDHRDVAPARGEALRLLG